MNREEAKRRLEVWLKCMDCPEDKQCYDSHLHSTCEYTDYCDETPICEAVKVAIKALEQEPCEDTIDRKLVCAFIDGLISDDGEREKGLEYIRNMPPVETHDKRTETHACDYIHRQDVLNLAKKGVLISNGNYESVCKAINELPPVNPQEPKTDSWSIKDVADTFKKHGLIRKQEPCEDARRKGAIKND